MLAITGFKMVMSKGNPGAMKAAKDLLINICIGVILILSAWTLVDTLLKILVRDDANVELINFGPQYRIEAADCGGSLATGDAVTDFDAPEVVENGLDLGRDGLGIMIQGSSVTMAGVQANPGGGGSNGSVASLSGGGTATVTACNPADIRRINFMGSSVEVHRSFVASAQRVDQRWRAGGGNSGMYRVYSVGGYNCRNIAGTNTRSVHAYGLAIDINPNENPHCPSNSRCNDRNVLITDMPARFINIFIAEGWGWGGNWSSSKDAMHFSKATGEGGNMRGD